MTKSLSVSMEKYVRLKQLYYSLLVAVCLFFLFLSSAYAATDHSSLITAYEGSKTCRTCHEEAMQEVVDSIHFKLMGETQDVYNMFTNQPVEGTHGKGNRY
jgi:hypothetical protein